MTSTTDPPASLFAALVQLQAELPHVGKDKTAKVVTKEKGTYSYDYANLASVVMALKPLMGPLGLAFTSKPTIVVRDGGEREFVLAYKLVHAPSGETDAGEYLLPDPVRVTPQQIGSAITYARRYCLCAVTGVAPDDDDDDGQQAPKPRRTRSPKELQGADLRAHNALRRDGEPGVQDVTSGKFQRRINSADPDDPWHSVDRNGERQPTGDLPGAPYPPASRQLGVLQAHFKRLGFDEEADREERLRTTARIARSGEISSAKELTQEQVQRAVKVLEKCKDRSQLIEAMVELAESDGAGA